MSLQPQEIRKRRPRVTVDEPRQFRVVFHNDDVTTFDFVIRVLKQVFFRTQAEAEKLALKVHNEGQSTVGIYSRDIAESKASRTMDLARAENFPLKVTTDPE